MQKITPFNVIFLSGGNGTRMGSDVPKQYLKIRHKLLALYSFGVFLSLPEVSEIIVVCEPAYDYIFLEAAAHAQGPVIKFARPGPRRQDSVYNGIQLLDGDPLVCIHDSARPFINPKLVRHIVQGADKWEAAVVGCRVKSTIKVEKGDQIVDYTPDRQNLWEVQTPQVVRLSLLQEGFQKALEKNLTVTDDVSLVELLGKPVKIVEGSYDNIKITTPEDLRFAEQLIEKYALL